MSQEFGKFQDLSDMFNSDSFEDFKKKASESKLSAPEPDDDGFNYAKELLASENIFSPTGQFLSPTEIAPKPKTRARRSAQAKIIESANLAATAILNDQFSTPKARAPRKSTAKVKEALPQPNTNRRGRRQVRQQQTAPPSETITIPSDTPFEQMSSINAFDLMMQTAPVNSLTLRTLRRNFIAEIAAREKTVGYIDLISSPLPRIEGVINVDSDEESVTENNTTTEKESDTLELDFDVDNPEISVKIIWCNGKPESFQLRRYQKFSEIFHVFAERVNNPIEKIVFNLNTKFVMPDDTPASIDYKIYEFIHGRVVDDGLDLPTPKVKKSAGKIKLKIQSDRWKRPLEVDLLKTDKFKILYIKCGEELKIPYSDFKLSFDGEHLEINESPMALELEGGELIDLRFKK